MSEVKRKAVGFSSVKPQNRRQRDPYPHEVVSLVEWPKKPSYVEMRFLPVELANGLPGMISTGAHWFKIQVMDRETKKTRVVNVSKNCLAFDAETQQRDTTKKCPYCEIGTSGKDGNSRFSVTFYALAILRSLQEKAPAKIKKTPEEKKTGVITMDSESYTPVRVVKLPPSLAEKLQEFGARNFVKTKKGKKAYDISDAKYGIDVSIKFDDSKAGGDKYTIDKGERTPLTEEELELLVWDLNTIPGPESLKDAKAGAADLKPKLLGAEEEYEEEDEDEEDEDEAPKGKKKPVKKKKEEEDEEEDEEEEPPKKGKKVVKKTAKKKKDEDDDDLDLDEDEDD